jgi:NAD+ diphosphatase
LLTLVERADFWTGLASTPPYAGLRLDRGAGRRADDAWLAAAVADPQARVRPLWRDQCLVTGDPAVPVVLAVGAIGDTPPAELVLLGVDDDGPQFAVDLSELPAADVLARTDADAVVDLRSLFGSLPAADAAAIAYARGLLRSNRGQRFCGRCGARTEPRNAGHLHVCTSASCGELIFPRIEPAVITLVETLARPRRCLMARHRDSKVGGYSLLAGFVEIGESLEDAVRREISEEVGIALSRVAYVGSQPWPFPSGLMVAFRAVAAEESVSVDGTEVVEARWFTREELREYALSTGRLGRADSIDRLMLTIWLEESE